MFLRVLWNCYELARNQWLTPSEFKQLQSKRLQAILQHAYTKVPLYRKKFDEADITPDDIRTVDDLHKLPVTTKQEIKQGIPDQCIAEGFNIDDCVRWGSSGTTGGPMPVYYDRRFWDYVVADRFYRAKKVIGGNLWDKVMNIQFHMPAPTGAPLAVAPRPSRRRAALGSATSFFKRWFEQISISYSADEIIQNLIDYQPKILVGNAFYLRLVAEVLVDQGVDKLSLKAAISIGDLLDEPTRQFLESTFRCDVFDSYGAAEVGGIARECSQKAGLHARSDLVIVEILRNGEPAAAGELGDIIVTGLLNYAMPMIRYRVGDIGIRASKPCSCGWHSPLLQSVEGRIVDSFILPDGSAVTPKAVMTVIQGTPGVSRYQAVQERADQVRIELMARPCDPPVAVNELINRCHTLLGTDVDIQVAVTDRTDLKAKFRPVISKLTVSWEPRWIQPRTRKKKALFTS